MMITKELHCQPLYTEMMSTAQVVPVSLAASGRAIATMSSSSPIVTLSIAPCPPSPSIPLSPASPASNDLPVPPSVVSPNSSPSTPTNKKQRRCRLRTIRFGPDQTQGIEHSSVFTQDEKDDRWYRSSEIQEMKESARNLVRERAAEEHTKKTGAVVSNESSDDDDSNDSTGSTTTLTAPNAHASDTEFDSIRGLDVYYPSRQRHCKKFIVHVLEAYHVRCVGRQRTEHVAFLAHKWSQTSRSRASQAAHRDYETAYEEPAAAANEPAQQ